MFVFVLVAIFIQVPLCLAGLFVGARSGAGRATYGGGLRLMLIVLSAAIVAVVALSMPRYGEHTRLPQGVAADVLALAVAPQLWCQWLGGRIGKRHPEPTEARTTAIITRLVAVGVVVVPLSVVVFLFAFTLTACDAGQYDCPFG